LLLEAGDSAFKHCQEQQETRRSKKMDQSDVERRSRRSRAARRRSGVLSTQPGLSRLKVERALHALEKQKLLLRDRAGFHGTWHAGDATGPAMWIVLPLLYAARSEWMSGNRRMSGAGIATLDKGCTIYDDRPQMCRSSAAPGCKVILPTSGFPSGRAMVVH